MGSGQQKIQNYSWGGLSESRSEAKAEKNLQRMQGQIGQTEQKLEGLMAQRPGYNFSYGSPEFQRLRQQSAGAGPLDQYEQARTLLDLKSRQNIDGQTADLAGQQAGAYSQLAMGGGLSGGQRERVAQSGLQGNIQARQALRGETQNQYAGIAAQEAQEKIGLQKQIAEIAASEDQRRQEMEHNRWKTEMETRASIEKSRQQANATAASSCFAPGTMVEMFDGSTKRIEHVKIGDKLKLGGEVYCTQVARFDQECFQFGEDIYVTGSHAVYEDGQFIRVKDSKVARPISYKLSTVYNLGVTNHKIVVGGYLFSDLHETDRYEQVTEEQSLYELNNQHTMALSQITEHNEQPGTKVY